MPGALDASPGAPGLFVFSPACHRSPPCSPRRWTSCRRCRESCWVRIGSGTPRLRTRRCRERPPRLGRRVRAGGLRVFPAANSFAPADRTLPDPIRNEHHSPRTGLRLRSPRRISRITPPIRRLPPREALSFGRPPPLPPFPPCESRRPTLRAAGTRRISRDQKALETGGCGPPAGETPAPSLACRLHPLPKLMPILRALPGPVRGQPFRRSTGSV
jgi:hypothetical protein